MVGTNCLDGLREFRLGVLNDMALVQNTIMPVEIGEVSNVVPYDFVRSYNHVMILDRRQKFISFPRWANVNHWLQVIRVLQYLIRPVSCKSGWAYHDRG